MFRVRLSHENVEKLSAVMAQKGLKNYGEVLSAAINYPNGTFTEVGSLACDGQGVTVTIAYDLRFEAEFDVLAKRRLCQSVPEWIEALLTE